MMTFQGACAYVGLPPSHRQYRKWCKNRGIAWRGTSGDVSIPAEEIFPAARLAIANDQLSRAGEYEV